MIKFIEYTKDEMDTDENKDIIMQITNFDSDIFFDITGIDVSNENNK